MSTRQLTLKFEAGLTDSFETCRELIQDRSYKQGRLQKHLAADMDLSPSYLSRKLAQSPNDNMRFTLDDFERYLQVTSDRDPIYYLIEKYLADDSGRIKALQEELERLQARQGRAA